MRDYAIEIPTGFRGEGPVSIRNEGSEPHEVALLRLADGKAVNDAFAWYAKPEGPPPFTAAGGIGVVDPDTPAWASLHLEPGNHVAVCFVPGPDGAPHALKGKVTPFHRGLGAPARARDPLMPPPGIIRHKSSQSGPAEARAATEDSPDHVFRGREQRVILLWHR